MNSIATILVGNFCLVSHFCRGEYIFPVLCIALEVMGKLYFCVCSNLCVVGVTTALNAPIPMHRQLVQCIFLGHFVYKS